MRGGLDMRVRTEAARILQQRGINPEGRDLDRRRLGRSNLIVMKAAIDRRVNSVVGRGSGERHDFSRDELEQINQAFVDLVAAAINEVIDGN